MTDEPKRPLTEAELADIRDQLVRTGLGALFEGISAAGKIANSYLEPLAVDPRVARARDDVTRVARAAFASRDALRADAGLDDAAGVDSEADDRQPDASMVRARFNALLARSSDVHDPDTEPALLAIIDALTPDEARMLRYLREVGAVPVVDLVRQSLTGAETLVPQLCMLADLAGVRHLERRAFYLQNLKRLGLVAVVHAELPDGDYRLLEGHPDYVTASAKVREETAARPRMRKHQVCLTPLGDRLLAIALD